MKDDRRSRTFKGVISLVVLRSLWNGPSYGYSLEKEVERLIGLKLSNGEIYSILRNMEIRKLVRSREGIQAKQKRKYYEISSEGKKYLTDQVETMEQAINSFKEIIDFVQSVNEREMDNSVSSIHSDKDIIP